MWISHRKYLENNVFNLKGFFLFTVTLYGQYPWSVEIFSLSHWTLLALFRCTYLRDGLCHNKEKYSKTCICICQRHWALFVPIMRVSDNLFGLVHNKTSDQIASHITLNVVENLHVITIYLTQEYTTMCFPEIRGNFKMILWPNHKCCIIRILYLVNGVWKTLAE